MPTPGPWTTHQTSGRTQVAQTVREPQSNPQIICEVTERGTDEEFDNASLIAAAPDLLDAAEFASSWLFPTTKIDPHKAEEAKQLLQAAIRKAKEGD